MFIITLLFVVYSLSTKCTELKSGEFYSISDAFECINSVTVNETWTNTTVNALTKMFDTYVFLDILKNPPTTYGKDFYLTVNIKNRLKKLNLTETSAYKFMQQLQQIIYDTRDLHLSYRIRSNDNFKYYFDNMYVVLPFLIDIVNDGKDVILLPQSDLEHYKKGIIPQIIKDNSNITVKSINGMNPFAFIRKYAEEHTFLKSPHGRFTHAIESMSYCSLRSYSWTEDFLNEDINIKYVDGKTITINYQMLYIDPSKTSLKIQKRIERKRNEKTVSPITIKDFIEDDKKTDNGVFDFESDDKYLACKTSRDDGKEVNILVLKTFYPEDDMEDSFYDTFDSCIEQFDDNDYPIAIILPMNGGGYVKIAQIVEKLLAPHSDSDLIGSMRISEGTENCINNEYGDSLIFTENCSKTVDNNHPEDPLGKWYTNPKTIKYGDVEHIVTQPTLIGGKVFTEKFKKNPRKPQDVIVFTDGFCYSACSMLTKGLKELGGAIVVGFEGDPEGDLDVFDVGNSPTTVIGQSELFMTNVVDEITNLGGSMGISFYETYRYNYDYTETIPREYIIEPIDERVQIYKYDESKISQFIDEAVTIHEKYKEQCNPNNERLVKVDSKCDSKITTEHAHGGYKCGNDGKWSNECVATYCDDGYFYDFYNKKCVKYVCYKSDSFDSSELSQSSDFSKSSQSSKISDSSESSSSSYLSYAFVWFSLIMVLVI